MEEIHHLLCRNALEKEVGQGPNEKQAQEENNVTSFVKLGKGYLEWQQVDNTPLAKPVKTGERGYERNQSDIWWTVYDKEKEEYTEEGRNRGYESCNNFRLLKSKHLSFLGKVKMVYLIYERRSGKCAAAGVGCSRFEIIQLVTGKGEAGMWLLQHGCCLGFA
nr:hypothetical protein Iba_chr02dCG2920 [Ipomoea batatas]